MAKDPQNLVRLSNTIRKAVSGLGGDPDFIDFVLAWYGLLGHETTKPRTWQYWSTSDQQRKKRQLKKQYGKEWRVQWERAKAAAKFYSRKTRFNTNLFAIEPARKVPHRMMKDGFWFAMSDTKNYFARQSRSPHWNIVQTMFYPISEQSHGYAQSEYTKRKKFLGRFDAEIRLERLVSLYGRFQPVIHKVIESGTPLWAPPHREETQEILNRLKPDEILDIMPWHSSLTRQTLRLSQHGIEMKEA